MDIYIQQLKLHFPDLKEAEIEGLLYELKANPDATNAEVIRATGMPEETVKRFRAQAPLEDLEKLQPKPYTWAIYRPTDGKQNLVQQLKEIREKYNLKPKREFDQFFATEETSVSKALIIKNKGLVTGKHLLLLGDDDLVSIVLALIGEPYAEITVFDIDTDILNAIEKISADLNLKNIRTRQIDFRKDLKSSDMNKFDVIVTDPPYTRNGISLFLNTATKLLKSSGYVYLYYGNSYKSPEKTLKIQEVISKYNFVIEDKIDKFARYYGAESIGSASSLYILKGTPFTQPVEEAILQENIYTFEDQKEEKFPFVDHFTFQITKIPLYIVSSKKALTKVVDKFCELHKLKVVDTKVTQFKGKGLSLTYILSTSNLLVHTWPELGAVHMDLITCSPIYNKEQLGSSLAKLFGTNSIEIRKVE